MNKQADLHSGGEAKKRGEIIKRRRLPLLNPLTPEQAQQTRERLQSMAGVKEVRIKGSRITLSYDLLQVKLAQLESAFDTMEAVLNKTWWQGLRSAWIHNTETNELANITASQGACCSRPPPRVSGR